jgi:23S rRNA (guanosine2251-2'-O)-methyltransferase
VEGRRAVHALLTAEQRRVRDVWVYEGAVVSAAVTDILELARSRRVPVRSVTRSQLEREARTESPQGVIAHAVPLAEVAVDDLCQGADEGRGAPFLVVVEGVTDPHNLGSILRSAECAGATGAVLPRHGGALITPAVTKAAAGAVEHVAMAVVSGVAGVLPQLRRHGVWSIGLDTASPTTLFEVDLATEAVALVLGSEGSGLSRLTRQRCDVVASIPLHGVIESLNVAAAAAVACFEIERKRAREP